MNLVRFQNSPLFAGLFRDFENEFFNKPEMERGDIPAVNIKEDEKQYVLEMAAPGLKKEDFKINLDNQILTISREVEEKKEEKNENYTRREFWFNSFSRSFTLPETIDFDKIKADYRNGILKITLPKDEKARLTRDIKIQ